MEAKCLATAIGSLPHKNVDRSLRVATKLFPKIPFWPQLPNSDFRENMYVQFTEGMPGISVDRGKERVYFDRGRELSNEAEQLFHDFLNENIEPYAITPDYARGLYRLIEILETGALTDIAMIKGQITGPVSMGLAVTDEERRPSLYDDLLRDIILKTIQLKIKWQEKTLTSARPGIETLIFIDEPYLVSYGSAFVSLNREDVIGQLEEVISSINGFSGIHCCGNTDWSLVAETSVDVISFDAYDYAHTIALYPKHIRNFLERGGVLAWGIVPSGLPSPDQVTREDVDSLVDKLETGMEALVEKGLDKETLVHSALITPNCGTGAMDVSLAEQTFKLTKAVSDTMRKKYFSY